MLSIMSWSISLSRQTKLAYMLTNALTDTLICLFWKMPLGISLEMSMSSMIILLLNVNKSKFIKSFYLNLSLIPIISWNEIWSRTSSILFNSAVYGSQRVLFWQISTFKTLYNSTLISFWFSLRLKYVLIGTSVFISLFPLKNRMYWTGKPSATKACEVASMSSPTSTSAWHSGVQGSLVFKSK